MVRVYYTLIVLYVVTFACMCLIIWSKDKTITELDTLVSRQGKWITKVSHERDSLRHLNKSLRYSACVILRGKYQYTPAIFSSMQQIDGLSTFYHRHVSEGCLDTLLGQYEDERDTMSKHYSQFD